MSLPTGFAENLLHADIGVSQIETYDRKKAIGILVDYVGLLHETLITNHSELRMNGSE